VKLIRKIEKRLNNKRLVFLLFLVLGLASQTLVLLTPDDVLLNWFSSDDAFYYFKTAQNITEGRGITFDGISPTNGFHPLWMIVCIPVFALARINLYLPLRVLVFFLILMNAAAGFLIYRIFRKKSAWLGFSLGMFWMFFLPIHEKTTQMGLETGLTAFMLSFFLFTVSAIDWGISEKKVHKNLAMAGLAGLGLLLSRLDNIFLLVTIGVWLVFNGKKFNTVAQIDFFLLLISAVVSFFIRMQIYENMFEYLDFYFLLMGLSLVLRPMFLFFGGAYQPIKNRIMDYLIRMIIVSIISSGLIFTLLLLAQNTFNIITGLSRGVVLFDAGLSLLLLTIHHLLQVRYGSLKGEENIDEGLFSDLKIWLMRALAYFSPIILGLSIYLVTNNSYAGSAMPVSGQIKRWWGTLPNTVYGRPISQLGGVVKGLLSPDREKGPFWLIMRPLMRFSDWILGSAGYTKGDSGINAWATLLVSILVLAILLYFLVIRERDKFSETQSFEMLLPLFAGVFMHAVSYKASGYMHVRGWYWTGEIVCILLFLGSVILHWCQKIAIKWGGSKIPFLITTLIGMGIYAQFTSAIIRQYPLDGNVPIQYNIPAERALFNAHTKPGDVIGMTGGGLSAYFIPDRVIVNLDGLINSAEYFVQLKNGDISHYLEETNVQYLYGSELVFLDSDPYRWFFENKLSLLDEGPYFNFYQYQP